MQDTVSLEELEKTAKMGSEETTMGVLGSFALKNAKEIQSWQDHFCELAGVYALCLDEMELPSATFPVTLRMWK